MEHPPPQPDGVCPLEGETYRHHGHEPQIWRSCVAPHTEGIYLHIISMHEVFEEDSEKVVVDLVRAPWYALANSH